ILYGKPSIQSINDPSVVFMNETVEAFSETTVPGTYLVDTFPILEHLPRWLSHWKQVVEKQFQSYDSRFHELFLSIKNSVISGHEQHPSFSSTLAENQTQHKISDRDCSWLSGTLYMAGHETTTTALMWFIFAMVLHPEVQKRAQDELDRVIGQSRLPSFADAKHLPYIQAILKEVLRWRPPGPFGLAHAINEDDYYDGYYIPKGSICIASSWSINRDPSVYGSDADEFRPERYLDKNGNLKDETSEGHFAYGFGQRLCVGRHVANNTLFISMATILWTMFLEPQKDAKGNPI
ncbi:cytochrome P450, partial [Dendrothele bispora CBS 962.96]